MSNYVFEELLNRYTLQIRLVATISSIYGIPLAEIEKLEKKLILDDKIEGMKKAGEQKKARRILHKHGLSHFTIVN